MHVGAAHEGHAARIDLHTWRFVNKKQPACDLLVNGGKGPAAVAEHARGDGNRRPPRDLDPGRRRAGCARARRPASRSRAAPVLVDGPPLRTAAPRRFGRRLLRAGGVWVADGAVHDHFVQFTEGVVAGEELSPAEPARRGRVGTLGADGIELALTLEGNRAGRLGLSLGADDELDLELTCEGEPLRLAIDWDRRAEEHFAGLGARHGTRFDQAGRAIQLGADRRYTGPDGPPEMLAAGGIPQGDCAPVPWLLSSRGSDASTAVSPMPMNGSPSTISSVALASAIGPGRFITRRDRRYQAPSSAGRASRSAARCSRAGASAFTRGPRTTRIAGSITSASPAAISATIAPPIPIEYRKRCGRRPARRSRS